MIMGNHRALCTFTMQPIGGLFHTPKAIPTFMVIARVIALLSLEHNVFVDSLYELAFEPFIRILGSSRISSMAPGAGGDSAGPRLARVGGSNQIGQPLTSRTASPP